MQLSKSASESKLLKLSSTLIIVLIFSFLSLWVTGKTWAATLSLDPVSANVTAGVAFDVALDIDTEGEKTTATDVILNYDPSMLEITNVAFSAPTLYPVNTKTIDNTNGKLLITSTQQDAVNAYTGTATLAILTLKVKSPGTAALLFDCTVNKTNDSNVFKTGTSQDVLNCAVLENGLYTTTGSITRAPTPTMLAPGNIGPTGLILGGGALLLGIGILAILAL